MSWPRTRALIVLWTMLPGVGLPALSCSDRGGSDSERASATRDRPNIVLFLADDMGIGDTSAYQDLSHIPDSDQLYTPNLEALAHEGIRFTDVHSAATCSPTRYTMLTGSYGLRGEVSRTDRGVVDLDRRTIGDMLQDAGYATYGIGKWHLGNVFEGANDTLLSGPTDFGFDHWTGFKKGYSKSNTKIIVDKSVKRFDVEGNLVPASRGTYSNEMMLQLLHDTAFDMLSRHQTGESGSNTPFFLYYSSQSNHHSFKGPDNLVLHDGAIAPVRGRGRTKDGSNVPTDSAFDPAVKRSAILERADRVRENDTVVGDLVKWLKTTDDPRDPGSRLWANTLFLFISDNGADKWADPLGVGALPIDGNPEMPAVHFRGNKGDAWEGGTRIPFIASWKGRIVPGQTSDALFGLNDLYATLANVAGYRLQPASPDAEAADSEDLLDALLGHSRGFVRNAELLYYRKNDRRVAIRDGHLKLIAQDSGTGYGNMQFFEDGELIGSPNDIVTGLFDLSTETGFSEQFNLLDVNNYPEGRTSPKYLENLSIASRLLRTMQTRIDYGFSRGGAGPGSENS